MPTLWSNATDMPAKRFRCGYCGFVVASDKGYGQRGTAGTIYTCPNCDGPTFFGNSQVPGSLCPAKT